MYKLIAHMDRTFSAIIHKEKGQDDLTRLRQKDGQPFDEFLADFESALARAGGYASDNESRVAWLRRGMSEALKNKLITVVLPPGFEEYVEVVQQVAWRFEQTGEFKSLASRYHRGRKNPAPPPFFRPRPHGFQLPVLEERRRADPGLRGGHVNADEPLCKRGEPEGTRRKTHSNERSP